jgi:hypothetical protein
LRLLGRAALDAIPRAVEPATLLIAAFNQIDRAPTFRTRHSDWPAIAHGAKEVFELKAKPVGRRM